MSILANTLLNRIIIHQKTLSPQKILKSLNLGLKKEFNKLENGEFIADGMDIALCEIDHKNNTLSYSGANRPLLLLKQNELITYTATRASIGYQANNVVFFEEHCIQISPKDRFFIFF